MIGTLLDKQHYRNHARREDVRREDARREDVRREDARREDVRREDARREDVRREDARREDVKIMYNIHIWSQYSIQDLEKEVT